MTLSTMPEDAAAGSPATEPSAFLGRQPILDRNQQLIGYELLYRADAAATAALVTDDDFASLVVVASMLQDLGAEQVLGGKMGFINVGPDTLGPDSPIVLLDPRRTSTPAASRRAPRRSRGSASCASPASASR
jgi:EAL and modified HD-GYP domain-containing signal transduction protein